MQRPVNIKRARGFLLIVAILVLVVVAIAVAALGNMTSADVSSSSEHAQSAQAYFAATSGLEVAKYQFKSGTACSSLTNTNSVVGPGQFSTTGTAYPGTFTAALSSNISASATVIPLSFTVGGISNLAPHGRILIGSESIDYSGTSGNSLTAAVRGTGGTTAATHIAGAAITQGTQCVIRAVGSLVNSTRVLEATVIPASSITSALFSGSSVAIGASSTSLTSAGFSTTLPAGDNYVIAAVTFSDTNTTARTIAAGNLKLVSGATTLAQSQSVISVGGGATAGANAFPQETQFLLAKDTGALANASYDVTAISSGGTDLNGRVQILVLSGIGSGNVSFATSASNVAIQTAATTLVSSGAISAGNNIIIAVAQLDRVSNAAGGTTIDASNLILSKAGSTLASNQYPIALDRGLNVNRGTGAMLVYLDSGAAAGATYDLSVLASDNRAVGYGYVLVFSGPTANFLDGSSTPIGNTAVSLVSNATTFPAGENVVVAPIQYQNGSGAQRNVAAGNETLTLGGSAVSSPASASAFNWNLCTSAANYCNDFYSGLLWRQSGGSANPTFGVQSKADNATAPMLSGEAKILAMNLGGVSSLTTISTLEIYP